ncbi:hypothetical protein GOQ04_24485, partial [Emticicia sp. ODNR4P]|nr:hypothetical protein [Emticicia sp. ODNR4P]
NTYLKLKNITLFKLLIRTIFGEAYSFFDTANYPSITFKSNSVQKGSGKALKVTGDLTMHGVTKPVTFDVTLNGIGENRQKKKLAGFKVVGNIKRSDFGVGGKTPSAVVSDEIELKANGEFVQN